MAYFICYFKIAQYCDKFTKTPIAILKNLFEEVMIILRNSSYGE